MADREEDKHEVLEKIGQGSFGIIRKVRNKTTRSISCRKEISYHRMSDKERQQLYAEITILERLKHPNIVQYITREHIKTSHDLHIYMEYCGNGDLGGYIKKLIKCNESATEDFVWTIFAQLICALYRCHNGENPSLPGSEDELKCHGRRGNATGLVSKKGQNIDIILHRDLKPENVFLGENNAVKLGDFGLSKTIKQNDFASTYVGTPYYMSPEICAGELYSHFSDIWSVGCIIYELAARKVPFEARSHTELIRKINAGKVEPLPPQYSRELNDTIAACLNTNSKGRPDSGSLLKVTNIKLARVRLQLTEERKKVLPLPQERDAALAKLAQAQKENQELRAEVQRLRERESKVESRVKMELEVRATLAIDQQVHEQVERQKAELHKQFEAAVEQRAEEKLGLHLASLPSNHGLEAGTSQNVRSCTPPPGKAMGSFTTTATTEGTTDRSSISSNVEKTGIETDMSSLSVQEEQAECQQDQGSPLSQRSRPKPRARKPMSRAQTYANCSNFNSMAQPSPIDVDMVDPSPLPPMSIKGLSLSPRKYGQDGLSGGAGLRRNIFQNAQQLRPQIPEDELEHDSSGFADDDSELLDDDPDDIPPPESPSRPTLGLSNDADPFKAFDSTKPKLPRPSLARQKTMPVGNLAPRARNNVFANKAKSPEKTQYGAGEKENRPPSSHARSNTASNVPVVSAATSPTRNTTTANKAALTPSRKAPAVPTTATATSNLAHQAVKNTLLSPSKVQGRTLVQLQQARSQPNLGDVSEEDRELGMDGAPRLAPAGSPAKWDPVRDGEEMPSPFLAKRCQRVR